MSPETDVRTDRVISGILLRSLAAQPLCGLLIGLAASFIDLRWGSGHTAMLLPAAVTGAIFGLVTALIATAISGAVVYFTTKYVRPPLGWFAHLMSTVVTSWWLITHDEVGVMPGMHLTVAIVVLSFPISWWCLTDVRRHDRGSE